MSEFLDAVSIGKERPNLGRAISKTGQVRYSSVSQIKLADPKEDGGCYRKWFYAYRLGLKETKTEAQKTGTDSAEKLEHYLKTGEECLPPLLQPGKKFFPAPDPVRHDLEVEEPLGNMVIAVAMRKLQLNPRHLPGPYEGYPGTAVELPDAIRRAAGLVAAGIPIDGAADCKHRRGEFVDEDGILKREHPAAVVGEVLDLKTCVRVFAHTIMRGENRGKVLPALAKTPAQVCADTQMLGYAWNMAERHSELTHVRMSHVVCEKSAKGLAVKRTGIITVDEIRNRWRRVDGVMARMVDFAKADKPEDVELNLNACEDYGFVDANGEYQKGCMHRAYCPQSHSQFTSNMLGVVKESGMSLFDSEPVASAPPAPPAPVLTAAEHEAAVAIEKAKLLSPAAPIYGYCGVCSAPLTASNTSKLQSGEVKHIGCARTAQTAPQPHLPSTVNPSDTIQPSILRSADPLPPEEIAKIENPALRAAVQAHADEHAEVARKEAAEKAAAKGSSPWCEPQMARVEITAEIALAKKYTCKCGKTWTVKFLKPTKENGVMSTVLPRHKPPKADEDKNDESAPAGSSFESFSTVPVAAPVASSVQTVPPQIALPLPPPAPPAPMPPAVVPASPPAPPVAVAVAPLPPVITVPVVPPIPPSDVTALVSPLVTPVSVVVLSPPAAVAAATAPLPLAPAILPGEISKHDPGDGTRATTHVMVPVTIASQLAMQGASPSIQIFVDILVERGQPLTPLEDYYNPIIDDAGLTAVPHWRKMVRLKPPAPGRYYARSSDLQAQAVISALGPLAEVFVPRVK